MPSGNDILLAARSHFRAARTVETLRKVAVPEWSDAEIYYWPEMDVAEKRAVFGHFSGLRPRSPAELFDAAITQVLLRSRDAFGNRLFRDDQEPALRDTHPDVLLRIANEFGWSATSLEEQEKNS